MVDAAYLLDRSLGLISSEEYKIISKKRILLVGCGLGSQIAVLLARTGFKNFILCDNDIVEKHNLNRQEFFLKDIGRNKAKVLAKRIKEVSKDAEIKVVEKHIKDKEEIKGLILSSDVVINMSDPAPEMYEINRQATKNNRPVFFPMNLGYISFLMVFDKRSKALEDVLGGEICGNGFYLELIARSFKKLPQSLNDLMQSVDKRVLTGDLPAPQIGVTAFITSALLVTTLLKYIKGERVKTAPEPIFIEPKCQN